MQDSPLSYLNAFTSITRNSFTLTTVAITIIGFANNFSESTMWIVKLMGFFVFTFAAIYAIKTSIAFQDIVNVSRKNAGENDHDLTRKQWDDLQWYIYATYFYILLISIIVILFSYIKIEKWVFKR